jgi:hypothetical protein
MSPGNTLSPGCSLQATPLALMAIAPPAPTDLTVPTAFTLAAMMIPFRFQGVTSENGKAQYEWTAKYTLRSLCAKNTAGVGGLILPRRAYISGGFT